MSKDDDVCQFLVLKLSWLKWWPDFFKELRFLGVESSPIGGALVVPHVADPLRHHPSYSVSFLDFALDLPPAFSSLTSSWA